MTRVDRLRIAHARRLLVAAAALLATGAVSSARDYVVAPGGSDSNAGTVAAPLLTISRAASRMRPGDTCYIRTGTYRETVRPDRSGEAGRPITFAAFPGEAPVVSGADPIRGWVKHDGHIHKARMAWTRNTPKRKAGMDQVFVDGVMMPEARWPNITVNPAAISRDDLARAESGEIVTPGGAEGSAATSRYAAKSLARFEADYWKGAHVFFVPGALWCGVTGDVTASGGGSITFTYNWLNGEKFYNTRAKDFFYLWGTLKALDSPGEWFRDASGVLHLWLPDDEAPAGHRIEAKRRDVCLDLRGKSHITISGLGLFAGGVRTSDASTDVILDGIDARYVGHGLWYAGWWSLATNDCVSLRGDRSVIRNSTVGYGAGHCVELRGSKLSAVNNVVHDAGYVTNGCNITTGGEEILVERNTIRGTGNQTCLDLSKTARSRAVYNDISHSGRLILDEAAVWVARDTDGQGTEIAYNVIHDTHAHDDGEQYYGNGAIYLEGRVSNFVIHHNVMYDLDGSGICLPGVEGDFVGVRVYNNTCEGTFCALLKTGMEFRNNVFSGFAFGRVPPVEMSGNVTFETKHGNMQFASDPGFVDAQRHDYRLRRGSALVDAGGRIEPFTDGFAGSAPDAGALESGRPPFVAGAVVSARHVRSLTIDFKGSPGPATLYQIRGLPEGRGLPADFKLKVGAGEAGGVVARRGEEWVVARVPFTRSPGEVRFFGQIGEGKPVRMKTARAVARVRGRARPVAKAPRRSPVAGAVGEFDAMLRTRLASALSDGRRMSTYLATLRRKATIVGIDDNGALKLEARGTSLSMAFGSLTFAERRELASSLARSGDETDYSIVAFFALAEGNDDEARTALSRCGELAALVEGFFTTPRARAADGGG